MRLWGVRLRSCIRQSLVQRWEGHFWGIAHFPFDMAA